MADRDELLGDVCYRLELANVIYKRHYGKPHHEVRYAVGDWGGVWLCVFHLAPASLQTLTAGKLRPCFFRSYDVSEIINEVAVRLTLPPRMRPHNVFHIDLKKFVGTPPDTPPPM